MRMKDDEEDVEKRAKRLEEEEKRDDRMRERPRGMRTGNLPDRDTIPSSMADNAQGHPARVVKSLHFLRPHGLGTFSKTSGRNVPLSLLTVRFRQRYISKLDKTMQWGRDMSTWGGGL